LIIDYRTIYGGQAPTYLTTSSYLAPGGGAPLNFCFQLKNTNDMTTPVEVGDPVFQANGLITTVSKRLILDGDDHISTEDRPWQVNQSSVGRTKWSVSMWIRADVLDDIGLLEEAQLFGQQSVRISTTSAGKVAVRVKDGSNTITETTNAAILSVNTTYNLIFTVDLVTQDIHIYLDGVDQAATATGTWPAFTYTDAQLDLLIGTNVGFGYFSLTGAMNLICFYNGVLAPDQIAALQVPKTANEDLNPPPPASDPSQPWARYRYRHWRISWRTDT